MAKNKNNNIWYIIGVVVIVILIIVVIVIQLQNRQKQAELERELQRIQEEKEFCDSLEISIGDGNIGELPVGVNYAFCSNKNTPAKSIITLKNGLTQEETESLSEDSCHLQQIIHWVGYTGSGYNGGVNCEDVASIELVSERCPQVKDIVTNMNEITCGFGKDTIIIPVF